MGRRGSDGFFKYRWPLLCAVLFSQDSFRGVPAEVAEQAITDAESRECGPSRRHRSIREPPLADAQSRPYQDRPTREKLIRRGEIDPEQGMPVGALVALRSCVNSKV